jgi:nitrogen fixation NifU-like protein
MLYSEKVMQMFRDSKHYGKIENADGLGKVGNPKCGDVMWIYIKVDKGIITDAKFETFGCVAAIATSSMAIELIKGQPVEEALRITNKAVAEALDGLPPEKMHCSLLAEEGIKSAIEDYYSRQKNAA